MKKNQGITMITLVITIIILMILAGIGIDEGKNIIKKSELENLKTNMLLIKVKGKEYVENANFGLGTKIETASGEEKTKRIEKAKAELRGEDITDNMSDYETIITKEVSEFIYYYRLSTQNLKDIGLADVESSEDAGFYILKYDIKNVTVDIYNTKGFEYEENKYYSLSELQKIDI